MVVANLCRLMAFELMLLFGDRFGIASPQIPDVIVNQLAMIAFDTDPADQFALFEVVYESSNYLAIHCGAPLFVGLQVNQPYLLTMSVPYHNLLRTDHLHGNIP